MAGIYQNLNILWYFLELREKEYKKSTNFDVHVFTHFLFSYFSTFFFVLSYMNNDRK